VRTNKPTQTNTLVWSLTLISNAKTGRQVHKGGGMVIDKVKDTKSHYIL